MQLIINETISKLFTLKVTSILQKVNFYKTWSQLIKTKNLLMFIAVFLTLARFWFCSDFRPNTSVSSDTRLTSPTSDSPTTTNT